MAVISEHFKIDDHLGHSYTPQATARDILDWQWASERAPTTFSGDPWRTTSSGGSTFVIRNTMETKQAVNLGKMR